MLTAVVQGRIFPEDTPRVVFNLLQTSFVNKVIVSCWEGEEFNFDDSRVTVVKNTPPEIAGITNRNMQIVSSRGGISGVTTPYAAKFRSDQIISVDSLEMMNRFRLKFESEKRIFVCGDFSLPFHPRDHVYWGRTDDVKELFDIPLDPIPAPPGEHYDIYVRSETYIAQFYYARRDTRVAAMVDEPRRYLVDGAPEYHRALALSNELRDKYFHVFPRIQLDWPKHGIYGYRYDSQSVWERWYDEPWE